MAAVRVSGTIANDDKHAYIKIETLQAKTPPPPPQRFPETKKIQEGPVERETNDDFHIRL
jgi:hypothetical protein